MEATIAQGQSDVLIGSLSLKLDPTATYITSRREASVFSAQPSVSYNGVQTLRILLSSATEWCDPQSLHITFDIKNDEAKPLKFVAQPGSCIFDRLTVRASGVELENIPFYNRLCTMFDLFQSTEVRENQAVYGIPIQNGIPQEIAPGATVKVAMTLPLSAVFGQSNTKLLPLWSLSGGIEILLQMSNPLSHLIHGETDSKTYHLENIEAKVGMLMIDSQLQEKYFEQLSSGSSLLIHSKAWHCAESFLSASSGSFDCTFTRPYARLCTVFASFSTEKSAEDLKQGRTYVNSFDFFSEASNAVTSQLQIGTARYPENSVKGVAQAWFRLRQALGVSLSMAHSLSVDRNGYTSTQHVQGWDVEKLSMVSATGVNTNSSEIQLQVTGLTNADNSLQMKRAYLCFHHEVVFSIAAGQVSRMD